MHVIPLRLKLNMSAQAPSPRLMLNGQKPHDPPGSKTEAINYPRVVSSVSSNGTNVGSLNKLASPLASLSDSVLDSPSKPSTPPLPSDSFSGVDGDEDRQVLAECAGQPAI